MYIFDIISLNNVSLEVLGAQKMGEEMYCSL